MVADTKRHIDNARQILVGVVPNPISQIDQITYALIYKFMDDMDQSALKEGGEASFFTGDLEHYSWSQLLSPRIGNQERLNLYVEAFNRFTEAPQLPDLFREILKNAYLPYRSPEVLGLFLKEIEYFDYSHPEELGNAYEYLLSIMGSQGDAGQFRTPRHLIDFIVDVVQPTEKDRILDPACGTGGFLVKAYQHILAQHSGEKRLTPSQKQELMDQIEGYDIDPGMVRIAQVNMFLHQFKNPKIYQYDTLSMEERWREKYDVIMANPPFMSPKGGIKPHNKFSVKSTRSEVLFVDYIMNHLKPKGRAGIIVPEGIIFQSGTAYKQLRKNLIQDGLYGVVSLPSGIFQPYSGVKTSVLLFDNELARQSKELLFVKVEADGFDLGAQRRPNNKNDLPKALEAIRQWQKGEKTEHPLALYVEKSQIAENGDYNLSGDRYRIATDYSNAKWPMVKLGDVCEIGSSKRVFESEWKTEGIPFYRAREIVKLAENGFVDNELFISEEMFLEYSKKYGHPQKGDLMITGVGTLGICYRVKRNDRFYFKDGNIIWLKNFLKNVDSQFVEHLYKSDFLKEQIAAGANGGTVGTYTITNAKNTTIPLPPLEIQEQIVAELNCYQNIIAGAKQIIANWKPTINIDPEWKVTRLDDICSEITNGVNFSKDQTDSGAKFVNIKDLFTDIYIDTEKLERINISDQEIKRNKLKHGDILFVRSSVKYEGVGFPSLFKNNLDEPVVFCGFIIKATLNQDLIIPEFLLYLLRTQEYRKKVINLSNKANITNISQISIKSIVIPLPPLQIQQQIVERIESERILVESAKKLIQIYEQKTKTTVAKLWT